MTVITLKTLKESYLKKEVVCLPITHLQKDCNPFVKCLDWQCKISRDDVTKAIDNKAFIRRPVQRESVENHASRIAWLVMHKDDNAVELAVGNPSFQWFVNDGNHRIAAAIYRGDDSIMASISVFETKK
jgi:hypothetical protein